MDGKDSAITRLATEDRADLGSDGREVLLDARKVGVTFKVEGGTVEAVRDMNFQVHRGETIAIVGESGSGKSVTARVRDAAPLQARGDRQGHPDRARRPERAGPVGIGDARDARQQGVDDLPGADELAEPGLHHRQADRGGPAPAQPHVARGGAGTGAGAAQGGPHPRSRSATQAVSPPALGRTAPAGDDRDGAGEPARHPDRRRADDRPRRNGAGADPDAPARPQGQPRHVDGADHPRPDHRPEVLRLRLCHAARAGLRARAHGRALRPASPRLHPAPPRLRAARGGAARSTAPAPRCSKARACRSSTS